MITFSESLEIFYFSVAKPSFCFAKVKLIEVPVTSFVDNLRQLRTVQAVFVWKEGFDAACVLKNDLEVDERVEVVFRRLAIWLLGKPKYGSRIIISFLGTVGTGLQAFLCVSVQNIVNVVCDNTLRVTILQQKLSKIFNSGLH